jgi:hypothetical protein
MLRKSVIAGKTLRSVRSLAWQGTVAHTLPHGIIGAARAPQYHSCMQHSAFAHYQGEDSAPIVFTEEYRRRRLREMADERRYPSLEHLPIFQTLNRIGGLADMMKYLPPLKKVAEVGCYWGVSTEVLAMFAEHVYAVDIWPDEEVFRRFQERMKPYPNVTIVRGRSPEIADQFADGLLDLVYIDADHSFMPVRTDVLGWYPKVRNGGWISGHDWTSYAPHMQVVEAVRFTLGKPDRIFADTSWLIRKSMLRRRMFQWKNPGL